MSSFSLWELGRFGDIPKRRLENLSSDGRMWRPLSGQSLGQQRGP